MFYCTVVIMFWNRQRHRVSAKITRASGYTQIFIHSSFCFIYLFSVSFVWSIQRSWVLRHVGFFVCVCFRVFWEDHVTLGDTQAFYPLSEVSPILQLIYLLNQWNQGVNWENLFDSNSCSGNGMWRFAGTGAGCCPEGQVGWNSFPCKGPLLESSFCWSLQCPLDDGEALDTSGPGLDWMTSKILFSLKMS